MILHVRTITGAGGGPDKTILNSPRFLTQLGYRCECAFLHPPGDAAFEAIRQRAITWQAPIAEIDDGGPFDWRVATALLRICRQHKVDIWHAHDYKSNLLGHLLRRRHPMRLVTTVHGWVEYTLRTRLYYLVDRWSLPRYERVICVSDDLLQRVRRYGVPEKCSILIENAIDTDQYQRTQLAPAAKERLGWPAARYLVGAAGRLSPEKAFDVLIRAVQELQRQGTDVGLIISGDGPARDSLQALINECGLQNRVRLNGFQSDLRPFYEAMDLFVISSLREGLPNVLLEAMAMEVPVVATRIAGIPRVIADGENGILVPPGNLPAMIDAVGRLLANADSRARLAAAAKGTIKQRYSFDVRMRKVAGIYDELLVER
jgi:glycosyltransferase involved in cell wall biosynthesis